MEASPNHLLAALPPDELERLRPHLKPVNIAARHVMTEADEALRHVYFILRGIVSFITVLEDGFQIEVAMAGNEGVVGAGIVLGSTTLGVQALAQIPVEVYRIEAATLKRLAHPSTALYDRLARYTVALQAMMAQTAACNCVHHVRKRLCKWLLMAHDRARADSFSLSHDVIAQMLGVRRPTITVVAGRLQKSRLIRYRRGHVTVLNRKGLEGCSCECYAAVRREYDRILR